MNKIIVRKLVKKEKLLSIKIKEIKIYEKIHIILSLQSEQLTNIGIKT